MSKQGTSLAIADLRELYTRGDATPADIIGQIFDRIGEQADSSVWIHLCERSAVQQRADALATGGALYGIPFAIKDNIDVAGLPTTAGCPAYAYVPDETATAQDAA